jgi:tocopherol O-methyltransferase
MHMGTSREDIGRQREREADKPRPARTSIIKRRSNPAANGEELSAVLLFYKPKWTVPPFSLTKLVAYYESKTHGILQRYGPGPRVHYHTGLVDRVPSISASPDELRRCLVASQEQMLWHAAKVWDAGTRLCGDVLDVGCGLGGGAIFWAQEFSAQVTAITIAPSHIEIVAKFAAQAGMESRVTPLLCDALTVPGENCFDAVLAIDSSSSFPRKPWFECVARLLRRGGRVFVYDCLLERPEYEGPFNNHWCAQIGTIEEYLKAARAAGLRAQTINDVSCRAAHFWTTTLAFMQKQAREKKLTRAQFLKLSESLRVHTLVRRGVLEGGLRHVLMSFVKH